MQLVSNTPWIPAWGIGYRVGIDGISLVMVLLTTFIMPLSVLASWRYITTRERGFYALMLTLLTGMLGVFIALDLFLFYVFWEVMLIPMYFIIGIWGGTNRLYASHQVLHLHDGRLAADAGGDRRPRVEGAERHRRCCRSPTTTC